jgi:hypothetical protein
VHLSNAEISNSGVPQGKIVVDIIIIVMIVKRIVHGFLVQDAAAAAGGPAGAPRRRPPAAAPQPDALGQRLGHIVGGPLAADQLPGPHALRRRLATPHHLVPLRAPLARPHAGAISLRQPHLPQLQTIPDAAELPPGPSQVAQLGIADQRRRRHHGRQPPPHIERVADRRRLQRTGQKQQPDPGGRLAATHQPEGGGAREDRAQDRDAATAEAGPSADDAVADPGGVAQQDGDGAVAASHQSARRG